MERIGQLLTVAGVASILFPLIGLVADLSGRSVPYAIAYAPTFVLGGILLFVIGIAIRTLAS